ncbi:MAG: aspartate aminotransferase family protein [Candidatus Dormibacteraceae bacterium]
MRRTSAEAQAVLSLEEEFLVPAMTIETGLVWQRASGSEVFDVDGRRYVDFSSGVLVTNVGHSHPRVVAAIQRQAETLVNCYLSPHPLRAEVASSLAALTPEPLKSVLLLTTGAEAVEAAIKLSRRATGKSEIVGFHGAFHGRTYMAMTVGGLSGVKRGFGPLVGGVLHAPYPYPYRCELHSQEPGHDCAQHCLEALEAMLAAEATGDVAAIVMEPYLGAGGSIVASSSFATGLRKLCDRIGALLILDEVQSGFGRTGTMFAYEQLGIVPDVLVLGKGIASGMPMSAVIARTDIAKSLPRGSLSSTYGGNPLACAAALATLEVIADEGLPQRAARLGQGLMDRLRSVAAELPLIGDVRGMGLAIGIELVRDPHSKQPAPEEARRVVARALEDGLVLIPPIGLLGNVIRIAPPLSIPEDELEEGVAILVEAIRKVGI